MQFRLKGSHSESHAGPYESSGRNLPVSASRVTKNVEGGGCVEDHGQRRHGPPTSVHLGAVHRVLAYLVVEVTVVSEQPLYIELTRK